MSKHGCAPIDTETETTSPTTIRVLVTAASRHGATAEIAGVIAEQLAAAGHDVDVQEPDSVHDLDSVDAVVLGSAVYLGHWLKPARELVTRLGPDLARRPVWMFSSGPVGDPPKPSDDPVDAAAAVAATGAREHRVFAGHVNRDQLGLAERAMVRTFHASVGDFRDWDEIKGWARDIDGQLGATR
jgi:menaquinone-dependent protoporphyrinogen oxidase